MDGRCNRRNKAVFSNFSCVVWRLPRRLVLSRSIIINLLIYIAPFNKRIAISYAVILKENRGGRVNKWFMGLGLVFRALTGFTCLRLNHKTLQYGKSHLH